MISFIICYRDEEIIEKLKQSIINTIHCEYEILNYFNKSNESLTRVYHKLTNLAKYQILCYCHEDIEFINKNWSETLINLLHVNSEIGLVGACGAKYKSRLPTPWNCVQKKYYRSNFIQGNNGQEVENVQIDSDYYSEVAVIDGCFMACRKDLFQQFSWNTSDLRGFHLYDLDLCFQVFGIKKIVVSSEIKIIHKSLGNYSNGWIEDSIKIHKKYSEKLPLFIDLPQKETIKIEQFSILCFLKLLIATKSDKIIISKFILKNIKILYRERLFYSAIKYLVFD